MRLLLPAAAYPPLGKGGGPVATELIARGLVARGHIVRVLTAADDVALAARDGVEIKYIGSPNLHWNYWRQNPTWRKLGWHLLENYNPRAYATARREIEAFKPDAVLTVSIENVNVATWRAAQDLGVPVAHAIQSYFLMCWRGSMFRSGRNCNRRCIDCRALSIGKKRLSRHVDGVVAETAFALDAHRTAGYFPNAIDRVIPGGVDLDAAPPQRRIGAHERLTVGYIGLHARPKGIETLGRAAQRLDDAAVDFLVAGDGDDAYTAALRRLFPADRTRFLGWTDPDAFYRMVDLVVVPSLWNEPFGRVRVEPLAYGVPVVVARSGGLAEHLAEHLAEQLPEHLADGAGDTSFPPGDDAALAAVVRRLAADRAHLQALGDSARRFAERFRHTRIAAEIEAFLIDVAAHAARRRATLADAPRSNV